MGIVDFLQDWTARKKIERAAKIYILGQEAEGVSVNHPLPYKIRFQNKMNEIFDLEGHVNKRKSHMQHLIDGKSKQQLTGRALVPQKSAPKATSGNRHKSDDKHVANSAETDKDSKLEMDLIGSNYQQKNSTDEVYTNHSLLASTSADDFDHLIAEV